MTKLSMADRVFNESYFKMKEKKETEAKSYVDELVKNFNMKKEKQLRDKSKNKLIEKIDKCDGTDDKQVTKLIDDYIEFSKKYVVELQWEPVDLCESFKRLLDRAKRIEGKSMKKLIKSYNLQEGLFFTEHDYIDLFSYIKKSEIDEDLIYRVIIAGHGKALEGIQIDEKLLKDIKEKAFKDFKKILEKILIEKKIYIGSELIRRNISNGELDDPLSWIEVLSSDTWDLDEDVLEILLKSGCRVDKKDYISFKGIEREKFNKMLDWWYKKVA